MPGYTFDLVEEKEHLLCSVCRDPMYDAVETACGHHFCSECLEDAIGHCQVCPVCRQEVNSTDIHPLVAVRRIIKSATVHCLYHNQGCMHTAAMTDIETHVSSCPYHPVSCVMGCGSKVAPRNMDLHTKNMCPHRLVLCEHCSKNIRASKFEEHIQECQHTTPANNEDAAQNKTENSNSLTEISCQIAEEDSISTTSSTSRRKCLPVGCVVHVVMTLNESPPALSLGQACKRKADLCGSGLSCDFKTHTCLLQAGQLCNGMLEGVCVSGAECDVNSTVCDCSNSTVLLHNNVCGHRLGDRCEAGAEDLCWGGSKCDDLSQTCQCPNVFIPYGDHCGLKVGVVGVDCNMVDHCVDHAHCNLTSQRCECQGNFHARRDGTCGLGVGLLTPDELCQASSDCTDNAICSRGRCQCDSSFSPLPDHTCGLRVGVVGVDCNTLDQCVSHAHCDLTTQNCQCEDSFHARRDGTCGLVIDSSLDCRHATACVDYALCDSKGKCTCDNSVSKPTGFVCGLLPDITVKTCNNIQCVEHASCHMDSQTSMASCQCNENTHWDPSTKTCEPDHAHRLMLTAGVAAMAVILHCVLLNLVLHGIM